MESGTGSAQSTSIAATSSTIAAAAAAAIATATATTTITTAPAIASTAASSSNTGSSNTGAGIPCSANPSGSNMTSVLVSSGSASSGALASAPNLSGSAPPIPQQQHTIDTTKQDDANNLSLASAMSEGQRSLSGAPSASSSPLLSPPGKIFGRNANGTLISTSRPSNEAEIQLYRVLQRASLLSYFDTLLEMGGDDVQQLYEAGEEEFLEIMALVGMASKPLHVRRLQKVLHEWASNPTLFQGPMLSTTPGLCDTPTKPTVIFNTDPSPSHARTKVPTYNPTPVFNPTPLISTVQTSSPHLLTQICTPAISVPVIQPHTPLVLPSTLTATTLATHPQASGSGSTAHQVTSSSPQLTPVLTEMQVSRITLGAEKIARQLPQREPRAQTSKKRTSRELEQVIAMSETDPRRMEEIRKYSAIYGRFDCKRRPEKPLTLHEVCVNEAAAQLCRLVPALLTRRDELFPLARQIVKDAGFGHSASIARYGGLLPQMQAQAGIQRTSVVVDCESSDSSSALSKRQRLSSTENASTPDVNREPAEDSRYNLFAMYQKFAKPPFDLSEIAKFSMVKSDFDDNDNDSRFSFSNSSSPSMPHNGSENERDFTEQLKLSGDEAHSTASVFQMCHQTQSDPPKRPTVPTITTHVHSKSTTTSPNRQQKNAAQSVPLETRSASEPIAALCSSRSPLGGGVQVISAAGGHIIAVANPALALSPTLNEALSLKRESDSPDI